MYVARNAESFMRQRFRCDLEARIESMIEDGELEPEDAQDYYESELEGWDDGYADMMYDRLKDGDFDEM